MAIAAMSERYGDRLVGQLAQAGGMIENGLKAVTTMKELQSLGQNLSQISPESPDYQQQLMQLGAAHPFAMQDPRGQALVSMGNQQHLQWKNQQFAMQQADRQEARADRRDEASFTRLGKRDASMHDYRMKEIDQRWGGNGEGGIDFSGGLPTKNTPASGFSDDTLGGASAANMGDPSMVQAEPSLFIDATLEEPTSPPAGFSARGQAMGDPNDKELQAAYRERGRIVQQAYGNRPLSRKEVERLVIAPVNKERAAGASADDKVIAQDKSLAARKQSEIDKREYDTQKLEKLQKASVEAAKTLADAKIEAASILAAGTFTDIQKGELKPMQEEMIRSIKYADLLLLKLREAEQSGEDYPQIQAQATAARIAANESTERYKNWMKENNRGRTTSTGKVFKDEADARASGAKAGDIITAINPQTGKPAQFRIK